MLVLLNGGSKATRCTSPQSAVPLADACVTEWRDCDTVLTGSDWLVPLADACVTEWRMTAPSTRGCPAARATR